MLPILEAVGQVDWDAFTLERLAEGLRDHPGGPDGEKMIWAFERALAVARIDEELLDYPLAAVTCLLAHRHDATPRDVLEAYFRRAVSDELWREKYRRLLT